MTKWVILLRNKVADRQMRNPDGPFCSETKALFNADLTVYVTFLAHFAPKYCLGIIP